MSFISRGRETLDPILILGCGDIGRRVTALYRAHGRAVHGLVHSDTSAARLAALGATALQGNLDQPDTLPILPTLNATLFYFAPPPSHGENDPRLEQVLQRIPAATLPRKVIYISTSGVYGDRQGGWVTEDTPPQPTTARSQRRLAAEHALLAWGTQHAVPVVILRVGGIYGPGRWPLARLRRGEPILRAEDCPYTNRIHADDLATVCVAAAERGQAGAIYNVSDGQPSTMAEYFTRVAERFGLPTPPQVDLATARAVLSREMMSYLDESRRMDNRKMLRELGVTLRYPDLRAGLTATEDERPT